MTEETDLSSYLARLRKALEILGSEESRETVVEIESHIREASSISGPSVAELMEQFGSPEVLAQRIVDERLASVLGDRQIEAPRWMLVLAYLIDGLVWFFVSFVLASILVTGVIFTFGLLDRWGHGQIWLALWAVFGLVLLGVWTWLYFLRRSRQGSSLRVGMLAMGIRRVRAGATTRTVRVRDFRYLSGRRGVRIVAVVVAVLVVSSIVASLIRTVASDSSSRNEAIATRAVDYADEGTAAITNVYRAVLTGESVDVIESIVHFADEKDAEALVQRRNSRQLGSYDISAVNLRTPLESSAFMPLHSTPSGQVELDIIVDEWNQNPTARIAAVFYDYRLKIVLPAAGQKAPVSPVIESVTAVSG